MLEQCRVRMPAPGIPQQHVSRRSELGMDFEEMHDRLVGEMVDQVEAVKGRIVVAELASISGRQIGDVFSRGSDSACDPLGDGFPPDVVQRPLVAVDESELKVGHVDEIEDLGGRSAAEAHDREWRLSRPGANLLQKLMDHGPPVTDGFGEGLIHAPCIDGPAEAVLRCGNAVVHHLDREIIAGIAAALIAAALQEIAGKENGKDLLLPDPDSARIRRGKKRKAIVCALAPNDDLALRRVPFGSQFDTLDLEAERIGYAPDIQCSRDGPDRRQVHLRGFRYGGERKVHGYLRGWRASRFPTFMAAVAVTVITK